MPYYCTVPRCTSMAGKAKNVSFHQFPRDEELARLWNNILKRGKPYTKYSKVCSLHFRPEDYTITSVGKNKGQWRTLRKDAIPSQNLPLESPGPTAPRTRSSGSWVPSVAPNVIDTRMQQQMAQAIYMQTMLAMQAATNGTPTLPTQNSSASQYIDSTEANTSSPSISEIEKLLQSHAPINGLDRLVDNQEEIPETKIIKQEGNTSYKCEECAKCFKDPDVFTLHRRVHTKRPDQDRLPDELLVVEKENVNSNSGISRQETLRANPILANLLKSGVPNDGNEPVPNTFNNVFDVNNILSIENQIMTALAANMESYIRNLSTMLHSQTSKDENDCSDLPDEENQSDEYNQNYDNDSNENKHLIMESNHAANESDHLTEETKFLINESNHSIDETNHSVERNEMDETNHYFDENNHSMDETNHSVERNKMDETNHSLDENNHSMDETNHLNEENNHQIKDDQSLRPESPIEDKYEACIKGLVDRDHTEPHCDKEDLNDSEDSNHFVIDESV